MTTREFNRALSEVKERKVSLNRIRNSAIAFLIENKGGLYDEGVNALNANDSKNCASPKNRTCWFMIPLVMAAFLTDPGEHTVEQLGTMCDCSGKNKVMRGTLDAFVKSKFLSQSKVKGAFVYKMDPVYEDTMPTRFDESSRRPNRDHNLANLKKIRSDYKAGAYQLGTQTLTGPAAAIKPYSSPPFNGNRKRPSIVSPEETRKNKSQNYLV